MHTKEQYFKRSMDIRSIDTPIYMGYPIYPTFVRLTITLDIQGYPTFIKQ